jgi:predicted GH43/DUF377 family glycosyl hydrolase
MMTKKLVPLSATVLALSLILSCGWAEDDNPPVPERNRYLLLDTRIVEKTENARLTLGEVEKHEGNPLFEEDKPWEKRYDNLYANVTFDEQDGLYKCWYNPFIVDNSAKGMTLEERNSIPYEPPEKREMGTCYAFSKDGIHWEKPELGIVEFNGNKNNNIVYRGPHGAGVFIDSRETDPAKRFKMFTAANDVDIDEDMAVAFSSDGIHWSRLVRCPEINPRPVDGTQYNALWVPELGKYVGFTRLRGKKEPDEEWGSIRQVGRTSSKDYLNWDQAELIFQGQEEHLQIYSMPVFRHAGVYLGLPVIFNTETDRSHTELAWSPDTIEWHRVCPGTPLIKTGKNRSDYDWGCVYGAAYPIFLEDEIRLYYGASNGPHTGWRDGFLCLATLRPDGFAGYTQIEPGATASITTTPIVHRKGTLRLSADVESDGFVKIRVLDEREEVLAESEPLNGSVSDKEITWRDGFSLDELGKGPARLQFEFKNATVYSFSFIE